MFSVFFSPFSPGLLASNAEIFPRILPKVLLTFGYFRQVFEPFGGAFCKNCTENIIVIFEQLLLYSRFSLSFVRSGAGGGRGRTPEGVWRCAQRHLRFALCCEWRARVLSILTPLPRGHAEAWPCRRCRARGGRGTHPAGAGDAVARLHPAYFQQARRSRPRV